MRIEFDYSAQQGYLTNSSIPCEGTELNRFDLIIHNLVKNYSLF